MRTIYHFAVPIFGGAIEHTFLGKIVHVACKGTDIVDFWVEVPNNDAVGETRKFEVFPTGVEIPSDAQYIGTALNPEGLYVWHLVERLV